MQDRNTFSTTYIIRKNRFNSKGQAAIYLRITIDGIRAEISTKYFIEFFSLMRYPFQANN